MEQYNFKTANKINIFNSRKSLIIIANIIEFFPLVEVLKMSKINKLFNDWIREKKKTNQIKEIKKNYVYYPILNLNCVDTIIQKILKENSFDREIVYEYFANYVFKHILSRIVHFHQHSNATIIELLKYYPGYPFKSEVGVLQLEDNNFKQESMDYILNSFLIIKPIENLIKITITNSHLSDDSLDPLMKYIDTNKNLKTLVLNSNEIGLTQKSLDFLKLFETNQNIEWISLDLNYFSHNAIEYLKEIYLSPRNKIKSLTMFYNLFSLNSIQRFFDINFEKINNKNNNERKMFAISYKYSPEYSLNNYMREVNFGRNFFFSKYDDSQFYDIYLENLKFETLTLNQIDPNLIYTVEKIFLNNNHLIGLSVDLFTLSEFCTNYILKLLTLDKLTKIFISEEKECKSFGISKFKFIDFLYTIKNLQNLQLLSLIKIAKFDLFSHLLQTLPQKLETLLLNDCKGDSYENLKELENFCAHNRINFEIKNYGFETKQI